MYKENPHPHPRPPPHQPLNSHVWLCDPMDCSMPGFSASTISWSLLKLMSTESVMPSSYLILCCPLLLLPSIFPKVRAFSNGSGLTSLPHIPDSLMLFLRLASKEATCVWIAVLKPGSSRTQSSYLQYAVQSVPLQCSACHPFEMIWFAHLFRCPLSLCWNVSSMRVSVLFMDVS